MRPQILLWTLIIKAQIDIFRDTWYYYHATEGYCVLVLGIIIPSAVLSLPARVTCYETRVT